MSSGQPAPCCASSTAQLPAPAPPANMLALQQGPAAQAMHRGPPLQAPAQQPARAQLGWPSAQAPAQHAQAFLHKSAPTEMRNRTLLRRAWASAPWMPTEPIEPSEPTSGGTAGTALGAAEGLHLGASLGAVLGRPAMVTAASMSPRLAPECKLFELMPHSILPATSCNPELVATCSARAVNVKPYIANEERLCHQ